MKTAIHKNPYISLDTAESETWSRGYWLRPYYRFSIGPGFILAKLELKDRGGVFHKVKVKDGKVSSRSLLYAFGKAG